MNLPILLLGNLNKEMIMAFNNQLVSLNKGKLSILKFRLKHKDKIL